MGIRPHDPLCDLSLCLCILRVARRGVKPTSGRASGRATASTASTWAWTPSACTTPPLAGRASACPTPSSLHRTPPRVR
eukprot:5604398-Prymnesium_polylepis.2